MRMLRFYISLILVAMLLGSCGFIFTAATKSEVKNVCAAVPGKKIPRAYSGIYYDYALVTSKNCKDFYGDCILSAYLLVVDMPLSFALDTAFLPLTIFTQLSEGNMCDGPEEAQGVILPGTTQNKHYRAYTGDELPHASLALLHMGDGRSIKVDGMYYVESSDYSIVQLLPGPHRIEWTSYFGARTMTAPGMKDSTGRNEIVTLEAGHSYRLRADRMKEYGYRMHMYIEDTLTGDVVGGEKQP